MRLVFNLTIKIILLITAGFAAKKTRLMDETAKEKLSMVLVNLMLPASMLASSQQAFGVEYLKGTGGIVLIAYLYYIFSFAAGAFIGKLGGFEQRKKAMFTLLIAFANTGFIGMPILGQVLGGTGTLYGAVYNCVFDSLYFSYGLYLIQKEKTNENMLGKLLKNPMLWVSAAAMVLYIVPWRFPAVCTETLNLLGDCMMPVSMLVIGAEIADMDLKKVLADRTSYGVSIIRMIIFPGIVFACMKLWNVPYEMAAAAVILSAMPSASLNVIMGQEYQCCPRLAASAVMQNTIIMIFTLPFFVYLCQHCLC